jgi:hypothetical protein
MNDKLDLSLLAKELQALETETFEIKDYTEASELLTAGKSAPTSCSTSSCTSTCSSTTSTTSTCA